MYKKYASKVKAIICCLIIASFTTFIYCDDCNGKKMLFSIFCLSIALTALILEGNHPKKQPIVTPEKKYLHENARYAHESAKYVNE